ncbi:MAG: hypothetical protein AAGN15_21905 [Cyanobacteria bacterium J06581_3]
MKVFSQHHRQLKSAVVRIACLLLATLTVWGGAMVPTAVADSVGVGSQKAAAIMRERAANEFERMGASKVGDVVEDMLESAAKNSPELDGAQLENAARKTKSKIERDVRRTKRGASELGDKIENAAENAADSVKDALD